MSRRFSPALVKPLLWPVCLAWRSGDMVRIRRLTALVGLAEARLVAEVAERLRTANGDYHQRSRSFFLNSLENWRDPQCKFDKSQWHKREFARNWCMPPIKPVDNAYIAELGRDNVHDQD